MAQALEGGPQVPRHLPAHGREAGGLLGRVRLGDLGGGGVFPRLPGGRGVLEAEGQGAGGGGPGVVERQEQGGMHVAQLPAEVDAEGGRLGITPPAHAGDVFADLGQAGIVQADHHVAVATPGERLRKQPVEERRRGPAAGGVEAILLEPVRAGEPEGAQHGGERLPSQAGGERQRVPHGARVGVGGGERGLPGGEKGEQRGYKHDESLCVMRWCGSSLIPHRGFFARRPPLPSPDDDNPHKQGPLLELG